MPLAFRPLGSRRDRGGGHVVPLLTAPFMHSSCYRWHPLYDSMGGVFMMKLRSVLFVVLVFAAAGVFAADRSVDVSAFASWVDPTGNGTVNRNAIDEVGVDFKHAAGY